MNAIAQRNACAHRVHVGGLGVRSMLDIGCETGELLVEMAAKDVQATGMIEVCERRRRKAGARLRGFAVAPSRITTGLRPAGI